MPESIRSHYVIVKGRRYPPKQVIAAVTGLDRNDFITTQARSVLARLGFTTGRIEQNETSKKAVDTKRAATEARLKREADMLRPYCGEYVAVDQDWTEVIVSGPEPADVVRALKALGRRGAIFRVPVDAAADMGSSLW